MNENKYLVPGKSSLSADRWILALPSVIRYINRVPYVYRSVCTISEIAVSLVLSLAGARNKNEKRYDYVCT